MIAISISSAGISQINQLSQNFEKEELSRLEESMDLHTSFNTDYKLRLDSTLTFRYLNESDSVKLVRSIFTYYGDEDYPKVMQDDSYYDSGTLSWLPVDRFITEFDEDGNIIGGEWHRNWPVFEEFRPFLRRENDYEDGLKIESRHYEYSSEDEDFVLSTFFTYQMVDSLMIEKLSLWNEQLQEFVLSRLNESVVINDTLITSTNYDWNKETEIWEIKDLYEYEYGPNSFLETFSEYNKITDQWIYFSKTENIYDGDFYTSTLYFYEDNTWLKHKKIQAELYSINKYLSYELFEWDVEKVAWVPDFYETNTYDVDGNQLTNLIYKYDAIDSTWEEDKIKYYFYSKHILSVNNISGISVSVYPNPAMDYLFFKNGSNAILKITIYDSQGILILSKNMSEEEEISVGHLKTGLYFYIIQEDDKLFSGKFLKG